jgi:hypothetical protein
MVTFINRAHVRPTMVRGKPVWGWTYRKAGFRDCGETKGGLIALQMLPEEMPEPRRARQRPDSQLPLFSVLAPERTLVVEPRRN